MDILAEMQDTTNNAIEDGDKPTRIRLGHYEYFKLIERLDKCVFTRCKSRDPEEVFGLKIEHTDRYHDFQVL